MLRCRAIRPICQRAFHKPTNAPTPSSIPDVGAIFGDALDARQSARDDKASSSEEEERLRDQLMTKKEERLSGIRLAQAHAAELHVSHREKGDRGAEVDRSFGGVWAGRWWEARGPQTSTDR